MNPITISEVTKSYNGKSGCMCGCRGKYSLPEGTDVAAMNETYGYERYTNEDISNRRVKLAINKINAAIAGVPEDEFKFGEYRDGLFSCGRTTHYAYVDDGRRNTVVYF